jgi:hypothetical protein
MKISSVLSLFAIWIATLVLPLTIFFRPASNAIAVLKNPASIVGTVQDLRSKEHRTVVVQYQVDGATYYSSTSLPESVGLPTFDQLRVGQQVPVVYRIGHPDSGLIGDPKKLLISIAEDCAFMSVFLLIFSIGFYAYLRVWLRKWRNN